jgi:hypothetical protein
VILVVRINLAQNPILNLRLWFGSSDWTILTIFLIANDTSISVSCITILLQRPQGHLLITVFIINFVLKYICIMNTPCSIFSRSCLFILQKNGCLLNARIFFLSVSPEAWRLVVCLMNLNYHPSFLYHDYHHYSGRRGWK